MVKKEPSFILSIENILGRRSDGRVCFNLQSSFIVCSKAWVEIRCANASDTFQCLVGTDQDTLQQANVATSELGFYGTIVSLPCIDGDFIQGSPTQQISSGKLNGVSIPSSTSLTIPKETLQERFLAVTNAFEGTIFVNPNISANMTLSDYASQLFPTLNAEQSNAAAMIYANISTLATTLDKAAAIMGECTYFRFIWVPFTKLIE